MNLELLELLYGNALLGVEERLLNNGKFQETYFLGICVNRERIRSGEALENFPGSKHMIKIELPRDYEFLGWSDRTKTNLTLLTIYETALER